MSVSNENHTPQEYEITELSSIRNVKIPEERRRRLSSTFQRRVSRVIEHSSLWLCLNEITCLGTPTTDGDSIVTILSSGELLSAQIIIRTAPTLKQEIWDKTLTLENPEKQSTCPISLKIKKILRHPAPRSATPRGSSARKQVRYPSPNAYNQLNIVTVKTSYYTITEATPSQKKAMIWIHHLNPVGSLRKFANKEKKGEKGKRGKEKKKEKLPPTSLSIPIPFSPHHQEQENPLFKSLSKWVPKALIIQYWQNPDTNALYLRKNPPL